MGDSPAVIFPAVKSLVLHVRARPASASLCWAGVLHQELGGEGLGICAAAVTGLCHPEGMLQLLLLGWVASRAETLPGNAAVHSQVIGTQLLEAGSPGPSLASLREDVMETGRLCSAGVSCTVR